MRYLLLTMMGLALYLSASHLIAQDTDTANFPVITASNAAQLVELMNWDAAGGNFTPAAFSPDSTALAFALNDGQIQFLSLETLKVTRNFSDVKTPAEWLVYSLDGSQLLLSNRFGGYTLWDVVTGEVLAFNDDGDSVNFVPTYNANKYIIYTDEDVVTVHDLITRLELLRVDEVDRFASSPDGNLLLTRNFDQIVRVWDIDTKKVAFQLAPPSDDISQTNLAFAGIGFTPDGQEIWANWPIIKRIEGIVHSHSTIQFWDITSGKMSLELVGNNFYSNLIFDPTGIYVVATGLFATSLSEGCWMWNIEENEELSCPAPGAANLSFGHDGKIVAYNFGTMSNLYIHEIEIVSRPLATFETPPSWFLKFSPDGRFLVTIDQKVRLWGVPPGS